MIAPPSSFLPKGAAAVLRACATEAEALGQLHPEVLKLIYDRQWFRSMVPERYGGLALPLPRVVRLEEGLSWADGSVGWTVTLCSGAGWFAGFFPPTALPELFSDRQLCIAGSGAPSGEADRDRYGSYKIDGRWDYASGAVHATAFTANCVVRDGGIPVLTAEGKPVVRPFLFKREEVRVRPDWKAVGLAATGSHGFEVFGLEVPAERGFMIGAATAAAGHPLYRFPFLPLAECTLSANVSGMSLHFLECCATVFSAKIAGGRLGPGAAVVMQDALEAAALGIGEKRAAFYSALDRSWMMVEASQVVAPEVTERLSEASKQLAASCLHWVDKLYPYAGLGAAFVDSEINRVWRDVHTASQHPLLAFNE